MRILDPDRCRDTTNEDEETVSELDRAFCSKRRKCGPCFGDGGAPAVDFNDEGEPVVLGLAVRTTRCGGEDGVDVFEGVAGYLRWMEDEVGVDFFTGGVDVEAGPSPPGVEEGISNASASPSVSVSPKEILEGVGLGGGSNWGWSLMATLGAFVMFGILVWVRHRTDSVHDFQFG